MQSFTIGDAIDIAVQKRHDERQNPKGDGKIFKSKVKETAGGGEPRTLEKR